MIGMSIAPEIVEYETPAVGMEGWNGIVLVGEAPGAEEVRQGRPFVGRSGKLLDEALAAAGIERSRCIVANTFRVRPPDNKVGHFFASRRAAKLGGFGLAEEYGCFASSWCRAEYADEIEHLREALGFLRHYLAKAGGKKDMATIALGRTPMWALTGQDGITEKAGKPLPCAFLPEHSIVPTFHPSFILRGNWAKKPEWVSHLAAAAAIREDSHSE